MKTEFGPKVVEVSVSNAASADGSSERNPLTAENGSDGSGTAAEEHAIVSYLPGLSWVGVNARDAKDSME